jgi:hypothetical protein
MFPWFIDLTEGDTLQERQCRRCGEGEGAVGAVNVTRSLDERSAGDLVEPQEFKSGACADDVSDGILRSDLVEADGFRGHPVDDSFRNGNALENSQRSLLYLGGETALGQESPDLCMIASVGMSRLMSVPVILVVMVCITPCLAIIPLHPEEPSRDAVSLTSLEPAGG